MNKNDMLNVARAWAIRHRLEDSWDAETSLDSKGWRPENPSYGHCAVVAMLANRLYGWKMVSSTVQGVSHWYNLADAGGLFIDMTADQFGNPLPVMVGGHYLYGGCKIRKMSEIDRKTEFRFNKLATRMGLSGDLLDISK